MKQFKKLSATIMVAVLMVLTLHIPVKAATSDAFLITANDTPYTQIVEPGEDVLLYVSPSNDYVTQSGFDTEEDAEAVDWSLVQGSTSGLTLSDPIAVENEDGTYLSCVEVNVSRYAYPGCASVKAVQQNGSYVNMTIIVNKRTISAYAVNYKIFANGDFSTAPTKQGMTLRVSASVFAGNTQYPNVADLTKKLEVNRVIDSANIFSSSYSTYLSGMVIDGVNYAENTDENYNYSGWQYRVYSVTGELIPLSEYVGIDDFELAAGQTVVWAYGVYGQVQFPETI